MLLSINGSQHPIPDREGTRISTGWQANIGGTEVVILLVIVLLLFGAKRIPELAEGLGSGVREVRKGVSGKYDKRKKCATTSGVGSYSQRRRGHDNAAGDENTRLGRAKQKLQET
jgi:sec-independent protein translocase protein TatA